MVITTQPSSFIANPLPRPLSFPFPAALSPRCQIGGRDQFGQYAARDSARLDEQRQIAQAQPHLEHHHHILLNQGSAKAFLPAAKRFLNALQTDPKWTTAEQRLWLLRSTADPTFGSLHGEPFPPRVQLVHQPGRGEAEGASASHAVQSWVRALDRAGHALSSFTSHTATFAHWAQFLKGTGFETLQSHHLVATEIINADWTNADTIPSLRQCLLQHADLSTQHGQALFFSVLQSVMEPTCFKTLEVYNSIDELKQHLHQFDNQFDEEVAPFRAAVSRVRQLYTCIGAL
ncbi:unnamed protein product [Agarophyton chilense]